MSSPTSNDRQHFLTLPFPLMEAGSGGLTSVLLREARFGHRDLHVLSTDNQSGRWHDIEVLAADPERRENSDRFKLWFGVGYWQMIFAESHTKPDASDDAIKAMFEGFESTQALGSLEMLLEFVAKHAPDFSAEEVFSDRFASLLSRIPDRAVINVQDPMFFVPLIQDHAAELRARGCWLTSHIHTALPSTETMMRSPLLSRFVRALMSNDVVYVHTDQIVARLEAAFSELAASDSATSHVPKVLRFDLGADEAFVTRGLNIVNRHNYTRAIPGFSGLSEQQRGVIDEVFSSQGRIPHRFFNGCRVDPAKGLEVVCAGVRGFLEERLAAGESLEGLRANYRFFFFNEFIERDKMDDVAAAKVDPTNLIHRYRGMVHDTMEALANDFPGIVFSTGALRGEQRIAIPSLTFDCHGLVGGTREGLNLMGTEILLANRNRPTHLIMGRGAGFAWQAENSGFGGGAKFVTPGAAIEFKNAVADAVRMRPDRSQRDALFQYIDSRRDSVVVDPL